MTIEERDNMTREEIIKQSIGTYNRLKAIVENYKGTLEDLCEELHGQNLCEDLFDVNYEEICSTVVLRDGELTLTTDYELWLSEDIYDYIDVDINELEVK